MDEGESKFDLGIVDEWVKMWDSYDLSMVDRLFLNDSMVSYFSSEKKGIIMGFDELRSHHEGFGFVRGGKSHSNKLWLEEIQHSVFDHAAVVTAIWCFKRSGSEKIQRGPVTLVYVKEGVEWRIAHANFSNYT